MHNLFNCCSIFSNKKNIKKCSISDFELKKFRNFSPTINKKNISKYLPLFNNTLKNVSLFKKFLKEVFYNSVKEFLYIRTVEDLIEFYKITLEDYKINDPKIESILLKIENKNVCNECNEKIMKIIFFKTIILFERIIYPNEKKFYIIYNCKFQILSLNNEFRSFFLKNLISLDISYIEDLNFDLLFILCANKIQNIKNQQEKKKIKTIRL